MEWIRQNSQYIMGFIRALILALAGFQVVVISTEQLSLGLACLEAFFAMITAKTTVSTTRVDTIVERRVNDIMSDPNDPSTRNNPPGANTSSGSSIRSYLLWMLIPYATFFLITQSGCASVPAGTSPEGTVAAVGKPILDDIRAAQAEMGKQGDQYPELRPHLKVGIQATVELFTHAESLGVVLMEMDKTDVTATKMQLADRARGILDVMMVGLTDINKNVDSQKARDVISAIISKLRIARALTQVYQALAPFLPKPQANNDLTFGGINAAYHTP